MTLSPVAISAFWAAGAGALSTIVIALVARIIRRRLRAKAIKVALYFEILGHNIFEVDLSPQGVPTFVIVGFSRASYDAFLGEIPDLLPQKLVGTISTYYVRATTAAFQQRQVDEDATKVRVAAQDLIDVQTRQADPDEVELKMQAGAQVADRQSKMIQHNRIILAIAKGQQEQLLRTLHKSFSYDPSNEPLDILPRYRPWLDKMAQDALDREKDKPMTKSSGENDPKGVAYYSALVSAWVETKIERDKTIVTLSAGAIGLLVTLLTVVGVKAPYVLWFYLIAFLGFGAAAVGSILIFDRNSVFLEQVVKGGTSDSKTLKRLDGLTLSSFGLGTIFTILIAVTSLHSGGSMKEQAKIQHDTTATSDSANEIKSFNGIQNLKPPVPRNPAATQQTQDVGQKPATAKPPASAGKKP